MRGIANVPLLTPVPVWECFQAALRRPHPIDATMVCGRMVEGEGGLAAVFWLSLASDKIQTVEYRCTSCATLVAICERLAQLLPGSPVSWALTLEPHALYEAVPGIPAARRNRAPLALHALLSAVQSALIGARIG